MATDAYDASVSNSQLNDQIRARIEAEFDSLDGAYTRAQDAAVELRDLAKALIFKDRSAPEEIFDPGLRFKRLAALDLIDEIKRFVECAHLGAEAVGSPRARDGLQVVLNHVIFGLNVLSESLDPAEPRAA